MCRCGLRRMQGGGMLSSQAIAMQTLLAGMAPEDRQANAAGIAPDQAILPLLQAPLPPAAMKTDEVVAHDANCDLHGSRA